ncbi:hypothetical protein ACFYUY_08585 [Kitasatospora sp. NPDC004745]|uniref:hypothetical protein n=1 Tax=Kitasatospora sp. NPDC004745 TaxID=3364019 RepID=UPI0036C26CD2
MAVRVAAQTTTALTLLTCVLMVRQERPAEPTTDARPPAAVIGPDQPDARGGLLPQEQTDRTGTSPLWPADAPVAAPRQLGGLGTLTARPAALRMAAAGVDGSRAADGAGVIAMPESAGGDQEWLVRPVADGEVVLQSLLVSTDEEAPQPLVLTADPDGSVYLAYELADERQQDGGQRWGVVDAHTPLGPPGREASDGRTATRLRLHTNGGGCLAEHGYGERVAVEGCDDPRSWWTVEGATGSA